MILMSSQQQKVKILFLINLLKQKKKMILQSMKKFLHLMMYINYIDLELEKDLLKEQETF